VPLQSLQEKQQHQDEGGESAMALILPPPSNGFLFLASTFAPQISLRSEGHRVFTARKPVQARDRASTSCNRQKFLVALDLYYSSP
jgi:hypothetical protein